MADFWAGYISGAVGIVVGNPLDLIKVRMQAGRQAAIDAENVSRNVSSRTALLKGVAAPILGYGALNAILFVSYNRTLKLMHEDPDTYSPLWKVWTAGIVGGLATWIVSSPSELVKCRAQLSATSASSWTITRQILKAHGIQGLYFGGMVTSLRDSIGYGFYFWSYQICRKSLGIKDDDSTQNALSVLLCGGIAGVVTWASIYPLDVIKTRVQTQAAFLPEEVRPESRGLLPDSQQANSGRPKIEGAVKIARDTYRAEGWQVFIKGLGVCSVRAFFVNAVQWAVYEWIMAKLDPKPSKSPVLSTY